MRRLIIVASLMAAASLVGTRSASITYLTNFAKSNNTHTNPNEQFLKS